MNKRFFPFAFIFLFAGCGPMKKSPEISDTCLADWNKQDPKSVMVNAIKSGVGLYGIAKPNENGLLMSISQYLSILVDSFIGDNKTIATFARVYNGHQLDFVSK